MLKASRSRIRSTQASPAPALRHRRPVRPYSTAPEFDSKKFLEKFSTHSFSSEAYAFFKPPAAVDLKRWFHQHKDIGCGQWSATQTGLIWARNCLPSEWQSLSNQAISRGAKEAFEGIAECLEENDITAIKQSGSLGSWTSALLSQWEEHMKNHKLSWTYKLHSVLDSHLTGIAVLIDMAGDKRDAETSSTYMTPAVTLITDSKLTPNEFPKISKIFASGEPKLHAVAWVKIDARESFEIFSEDKKSVFKNDGVVTHVWKFGTNLDENNYKWKIIDFDNQVAQRASQIIVENNVFVGDETSRSEVWAYTKDL